MTKLLNSLMFLILIVSGSLLAQAPDIEWVSTYNGPANGPDDTSDLTVDNTGNLYAVGSSFNGTNTDILIIKYNTTNGDTIWTRLYNGIANGDDAAAGCVLDGSNNLYVVGSSFNGTNKDYILIKYNVTNGDTVWTLRYNDPAGGDDIANDVALDGSGNIYVTGTSYNGTNNDYLTIKYNVSNGDTLWTRRYDGTAGGSDEAFGSAWDGSGNLYVSGYSYNGLNYNLLTVKYDANGNTLWTRKSPDTLDSLRFPKTDCVADGSGNVYVVGMVGININFGNRYSLITKYNTSGDTIWVSRYDGATIYDQPLGCALDGSSDLYVSGTSYNGSTHDDSFTIKYSSSNGDILWTKKYIDAPDSGSYGVSCVVDISGNLYITGTKAKIDSSGQIVESSFDGFTIKYTSTVTSVESSHETPITFALKQNYPNPINPPTKISYSIPNSGFVTLKIYDILGREVQTIISEFQKPGIYSVNFDASKFSSGVYFYKLQIDNGFVETKKMLLMR